MSLTIPRCFNLYEKTVRKFYDPSFFIFYFIRHFNKRYKHLSYFKVDNNDVPLLHNIIFIFTYTIKKIESFIKKIAKEDKKTEFDKNFVKKFKKILQNDFFKFNNKKNKEKLKQIKKLFSSENNEYSFKEICLMAFIILIIEKYNEDIPTKNHLPSVFKMYLKETHQAIDSDELSEQDYDVKEYGNF